MWTSVAVAEKLGRQWIGIDISATALGIMRRRMLKLGADPIVNAPASVDDLRTLSPFEFQNWVIDAMNGSHSPKKVGDMGIDGFFSHKGSNPGQAIRASWATDCRLIPNRGPSPRW